MTARLFVDAEDTALASGATLSLSANAARHVQVLRLQPGAPLILFDGRGGQWRAEVVDIGRKQVLARVLGHEAHEAELPVAVTLALGMPANERMDALVEKATELGAASLQPLVTTRSVLRVAGERAQRKARHWQAIAQAACEQCGRNRVPAVAEPSSLADWLAQPLAPAGRGLLLSLDPHAAPLLPWLQAHPTTSLVLLSGPEGGLTAQEQAAAQALGYVPVSLGARTLRADTAPMAAMACIAAMGANA